MSERRLTAVVLVVLVCVYANASESAQLDSHTSSDTLLNLQGDSKEDWELKHADAVASDAKDAGDEIKRKEAFLLDGLKVRSVVKVDPMKQPTPEEKRRHEHAGQTLLADPKAQCTPLIHYLHAQAARDATMIFTDKKLLAHVKFDMGDVWESKVDGILRAIQMNQAGVQQAVEPSQSQDLGEADEPLNPAAASDDEETLDAQLTLDRAKIRADNDDTETKALARMKSTQSAPLDEEEQVKPTEQPAEQLAVEKLLLAEEDPEHAAQRKRVSRASGDAEQWEYKAKANYKFMLALANAGGEEQEKYGAAQKAAREAAKAKQAQTWREKQRLCDAVLPTIADQMNGGAKWILSDVTFFAMAQKRLSAMDLAKLKSCVGALPEDQMVIPLGADASATAPPAVRSSGAQWLRALASKRFAKELKGEMKSIDDDDAASLAKMLVKQGIRSILAMETAPADVWDDIKPKLRAKLRAVVSAKSAP